MATLQAKRIKDALQKVKKVGRIEESTTILGCEITLQNLSPPEFEAALTAIEGLEDVAYAHAYQLEQVSRSLVQIDGTDLRDVEYIEDEVPVGHYILELVLPNKAMAEQVAGKLREQKFNPTITQQPDGGTKTFKQERHKWLQENVLKDWGREAMTVAWRKFTEVLIKADESAKKGVSFLIPDETAEDKFRRLLNDLKETEGDLPDEMTNRILDEAGFMKKTVREVLDRASEQLGLLRTPVPSEEEASEPTAPAPPPAQPASHVAPAAPPEAVQQAMASRTRMNQQGADIPIPAQPVETIPVSATPRVKVPDQIRRAAMQNTQGVVGGPQPVPQVVSQAQEPGGGISTRRQNRAAEIAALEAQADPTLLDQEGVPAMGPPQAEVAELSHNVQPIDPKGFGSIFNKPPVVGMNRKFRPRGG